MNPQRLLSVAAAATALVAFVAAGTADDLKQACQMCGNMNGGKAQYACPKTAVSSCNININGWCCKEKREHSQCKACFSANLDDADDEDDDDDE